MKGGMKKRLALLSILLVAGLAIAGMATAFGVSNLLRFAGKEVRVVAMGEQLKICENGKVVKEIPMPEGEYNFTIEAGGHKLTHKLVVHKMTKEEMEKIQAEHEKEMEKWIKMVNKHSRIQQLTNGKGIHSKDVISAITGSEDEVILTVKVEGKYYKITIDLNSETVKSIEEQSSAVIRNCYGPNGPIDCSKLPLHGPHAPK
ncbi:MAG: hypothetical protein DRP03_01900 [Candidatus Aenigmatarchaeota archaeon]|nr:MAG: hypothetical protein DRP03_01900 [Candidatus Aenigmarchaeota archaeon]